MSRKLQWWDVIALGVGGMMGAGIFVSTGSAAHSAGPALVVAYIVAGLSALLSALCYTEFAVEVPVAGGAFSYLRITFGMLALPTLLPIPFVNFTGDLWPYSRLEAIFHNHFNSLCLFRRPVVLFSGGFIAPCASLVICTSFALVKI